MGAMRAWVLLAVLLPFVGLRPAWAGNDPSGVLLLVNEDSPDSVAIGAHYAAKRSLPPKQVVRLKVPVKAELLFEEYRAAIEEPLRAHLAREGLEERTRCLVLTRGIPVRVRFEKGGYASTAALLESMDLPFCGIPQGGSIPTAPGDVISAADRQNPFRNGPFPEDRRPGGRPLRLVTSLDGWSAADAKALVDRSVAADAGPPADPLFVFQDANGGAAGRNAEYPAGVEALKARGFRTESHPAGGDLVKGRRSLMGWLSGGCYSALEEKSVATNAFAPGALVDMLESFGAVPENFEEKGGHSQFPVPIMVRAGASGVHGAVAEPYSHTFCDVRLFERYTSGLDLAESFHGSLPYLYWMNLVLGDPLCAPFAKRPAVEIEGLPAKATAAGPIRLKLSARTAPGGETPAVLDLFVDGEPVATVEGAQGEATVNPESLADGDHLVLAVARCEGPTRTRGWTAKPLAVDIGAPRIVRWSTPPDRPGAEWAGALPRTASLVLLDAGTAVEGKSHTDGTARRLEFLPASPLAPGKSYEMRIEGLPGPSRFFTAPATRLVIEGPADAVAGETVTLKISADGPLFGERIEVRLSDPPVLTALIDLPADAKSPLEVPVVIRRSGPASFRILARRSGAAGTHATVVKAGAATTLFLRIASNTPVGEPFDVAVEARDALGNAATDWTGTVALSAPSDPNAALPDPIEVKSGGRALFKGVVFETPGIQQIVAKAPGLEGMDDTMAEATTIRRWFVAGPFDEKEMAVDPGTLRPADGTVIGDRAWRFRAWGTPAVEAGKAKGVILAVAYVTFPKDMEAVLHLGHGGKAKAWFAGKAIGEGGADPKSALDREQVTVKVPAGPAALVLRVEVRGEGQDDFAARFTTADGRTIPGLRILSVRPFPITLLSISGIIRDAKGPVAGAEVRLSGGKNLKTKTNGEGWYGFPDLKPGAWRVIPTVKGRKCDPESKTVELKDAEGTGVDFGVR
jgi:uncharacterized protein (TIGR03790 family)